jgi:hypothetical protein
MNSRQIVIGTLQEVLRDIGRLNHLRLKGTGQRPLPLNRLYVGSIGFRLISSATGGFLQTLDNTSAHALRTLGTRAKGL